MSTQADRSEGWSTTGAQATASWFEPAGIAASRAMARSVAQSRQAAGPRE